MNGIVALVVLALQQVQPFDARAPELERLCDRVQRALFVRATADGGEFGADEIDPLLWHDSTWPASAAHHDAVLAVLDEFLASGDEVRSVDAVRRAVLQRDAWSVFDWQAEHGADDALLGRLAALMQRVALSPQECAALPDVLACTAVPGVPQDLLDPDGDWVCVGAQDGEVLAPIHVSHVTGRSVFSVHLRLPGGRSRTLEYLSTLGELTEPIVTGPDGVRHLSTALPQFPAGTTLALLRRALHVDRKGVLRATPIVESLQVRVHSLIPALALEDDGSMLQRTDPETLLQEQAFAEFVLDRAALFEPAHAGLRAVRSDPPFTTFATHGDPARGGGPLPVPAPDAGAPRPIDADADASPQTDLDANAPRQTDAAQPSPEASPRRCMSCHGHPGIYAWNSFTTVMTGPGTALMVDVRAGPRALSPHRPDREAQLTVDWKRRHPSWTALTERWSR